MKTKRKKRDPSKSISLWKEKAWKVFSLYIRRTYSDWRGYVECVTCHVAKPYKEMQAGHFISGRGNAILFVPTNVHPQCYSCNVMNHGEQLKYYRFMVQKYGEEEVSRLEKLSKKSVSSTIPELQAIIKTYESVPK